MNLKNLDLELKRAIDWRIGHATNMCLIRAKKKISKMDQGSDYLLANYFARETNIRRYKHD